MTEEEKERPSIPGAILISALLGVGALLLGTGVSGLLVSGVRTLAVIGELSGAVTTALLRIANSVGVQLVGIVIVSVLFLWYTGRGFGYVKVRSPTKEDTFLIILLPFLQIVISLLVAIIGIALGTESAGHSAVSSDMHVYVAIAGIVTSVLIVGPAEELLYRGVIQEYLKEAFGNFPEKYGVGVSIGVTSFLFAIIHLPAYGGFSQGIIPVLLSMITIFALSTVLGLMYEYTDNLIVPALGHGLYNALVFSAVFLGV